MVFFSKSKNRLSSLSATLFLAVFIPLLFAFANPALAGKAVVNLKFLHLNDTHGHIVPYIEKSIDPIHPVSGAEYLAKMIESERTANPDGTILLSAGDMFQGTAISNLFHGQPVIETMNYLKYDAMALGNHEFDWGRKVLDTIIASSAFPVLSANISERGGRKMKGVTPYVIIRKKNVRIAIIGITTPETVYTTKPGNLTGLSFAAPEKILPLLIKQVRAKGASLVVVLSHIGLDADRELARNVKGIDIIIGGHSHTAVTDPVVESGTIIVQAGSYGQYLGVLDVSFDPSTKKIVTYTRKSELKLVSPGSVKEFDPQVAGIVDKYDRQVKAEFSKVIGTATVDLIREASKESNLGDLVADAMREAAGAEIAFQNGGGLRENILVGPITLEKVFATLPFDNLLVSMDLSGDQVLGLLEKSILSEKMLQVSGLRVEYDLTRPTGSKVRTATIAGKPIEPGSIYRVATNDFLSVGGDQFVSFKEGKNVVVGAPIRDLVVEYIRSRSSIDTKTQGRITFK
ncbi:MAG: bifunctional UDP-sugar hydrolase/5'-nucleotidase [Syntrophobacteraceae bacterium]